ncbi:btb/poz domain-containing [Anaeramoeba flamelloides]|uniref:Btb/poz domain-containing n=1 Tax=Anaeramoeba flamelloides TaxID=1746091 RepID=A0AAV7ZPQ6_9EUKA|nr:btb/poz domain-containing [Anaeramoeba flamelloides]
MWVNGFALLGSYKKRNTFVGLTPKDKNKAQRIFKKINIHTTLLVTISASGSHLPSLLITPRKTLVKSYLSTEITNDLCFTHGPKGWITKEIFHDWVRDIFIPLINERRNDQNIPVLLVLDGHSSRLDLDSLESLAKANIQVAESKQFNIDKTYPKETTKTKPQTKRLEKINIKTNQHNKKLQSGEKEVKLKMLGNNTIGIYNNLIQDSEMSNVEFIIGKSSTVISGHKLIFAMSSAYWKKIFFSGAWQGSETQISRVVISDLDPETFQSVKRYIYLRECVINEKISFSLLLASTTFKLEGLQRKCKEFIEKKLSVSNCLSFLQKSINIGNHNIIKKISQFLSENFESIFQTPGCLNEIEIDLLKILLRSQLCKFGELVSNRIFERAKFICKSNNLQTNKQNIQEITQPLIQLVQKKPTSVLSTTQPNGGSSNQKNDNRSFGKTEKEKENENENEKEKETQPTIDNNNSLIFKFPNKKFYLELENDLNILNQPISVRKKINFQKNHINQPFEVLLMTTDSNTTHHKDVLNSISANMKNNNIKGNNWNVSFLNVSDQSPTFYSLRRYDSIFLYSSIDPFQSPTEIGNVLAEYVKDGGGLVVCSYRSLIKNATKYKKAELRGSIIDENFLPVHKGELRKEVRSFLGEILIRDHPIIKDVKEFNGGSLSYRIECKINKNGNPVLLQEVAKWDDNKPLILVKQLKPEFGKVAILNLWPVSGQIGSNKSRYAFWLPSTDGNLIIANAINYVMLN